MLYEHMLNLGYTTAEITKIIDTYPLNECLYSTLLNYLQNIYKFFWEFGFTKNEIKSIIKNNPSILSYDTDRMRKRVDELIEFGYTKRQVIIISKIYSNVYGYSIDRIRNKINDIINIGYSKREVIKMTSSFPTILGYSISNIMNKINDMINMGYTKDQVIKITNIFPIIYGYSIDNILNRFNSILNLGYTREQVIKMTVSFPKLYSYSIDNIREKKEFYETIGLINILEVMPKQIMQSVDLSYARYMFLKDSGIEVNKDNCYVLFTNQKQFGRRFGITNKELLDKYKYCDNDECFIKLKRVVL